MKNINYIINGVLALAVVVLYILHFSVKDEPAGIPGAASSSVGEMNSMPVAYINMDSLLQNYNYSKDLNEIIIRKEENMRANINQQRSALEVEVQDFQRKVNNNAFLSRERAEQEQQRLLKKQDELQNYGDRQTQELLAQHQRLTEQLRDSLISQLKTFNMDKGYRIIFSNTAKDNIILADDSYDITGELIKYLNSRYSPSSAPLK
ncbi:MAG: OmpH family outer membrane protein [Tannerellaceae bacterium]|jgi:outer membrane protein|nr:OmpH family outer membrane protein [Tannerellaceae bacterium]